MMEQQEEKELRRKLEIKCMIPIVEIEGRKCSMLVKPMGCPEQMSLGKLCLHDAFINIVCPFSMCMTQ